jgi:hypothetical protein
LVAGEAVNAVNGATGDGKDSLVLERGGGGFIAADERQRVALCNEEDLGRRINSSHGPHRPGGLHVHRRSRQEQNEGKTKDKAKSIRESSAPITRAWADK